MIKLVAVDVDDTLLNSQGKILESSREAITKAISKNVKVQEGPMLELKNSLMN